MTNLDKKVTEYHKLKMMRDSLAGRIEELSKQIKAELPQGKHTFGDLSLEIQVRDRTAIDELAAEEILMGLGLWDECAKQVVDPGAVEGMYLEGKITDHDLRQMRKPQYSVALITKEVSADV
jgi:hypothetical protein